MTDPPTRHCLFLTAGDPAHPSGGTLYNRCLARALEETGVAVTWHVVTRTGLAPAADELRALDCMIVVERPDVVLVDSIALASALPLGLKPHPPFVALMHYLPSRYPAYSWPRRQAWALLERLVLAKASLIVTMSEAARSDCLLVGAPRGRTVVIPPGRPEQLPELPRDRWPDRPTTFLNVAHWLPAKGVHTVVRAFDGLGDSRASLTLVGSQDVDPAYSRDVRQLIATSRYAQRIAAPGIVSPSDVARYYRAADVFVFPSRSETFGMAIVEAMGAGCPVVASRLGPLAELIDDGKSGYLVPPASVEAFTARMARLAADPELRRAMGWAAQARVRSHPTWRETMRNLVERILAL